MRKNKNTSKIILAIIVAALATMISYSVFKNMNNQLVEKQKLIELIQKTKASEYKNNYAYAVAKTDLKAGEIVSDEDVDFKQFEADNKNAFDNRSDVVNKILLQDISSGDVFTTAQIARISNDDISLKEGYRAVTLPAVSFQGKSDSMKAGSLVDVYKTDSDWSLENVKIMGFEGGKLGVTNISNASGITFEIAADEISDFISNSSKGNVILIARNAGDKKVLRKKHKTAYKSSYSAGAGMSSLPNLPSSPPISNFSGLPQPIQPVIQGPSVEIIEANVKSKVTFD
ncbi:MAG: SAF domain-containing protein [Candidatus Gastranaerophilaceae bacterium]